MSMMEESKMDDLAMAEWSARKSQMPPRGRHLRDRSYQFFLPCSLRIIPPDPIKVG